MFDRSSSRFNTITEGPYAFQKGYQVKLLSPACAEDSDDCFRSEISKFQESLMDHYLSEPGKKSVKVDVCASAIKSNNKVVLCCNTPKNSDETDTAICNKRGRPELDIEDHLRNIKNLRMQVDYYKSNNSNKKHEVVEKTVGEKTVELIKEGGAYTENINGEQCMSIVSGLLLQDLILMVARCFSPLKNRLQQK